MLPWRAQGRARQRGIEQPAEARPSRWAERQVIRAEARARLLHGIAKARLWLDRIVKGDAGEVARIAAEEGCTERSVRMTVNLAFLSPQLVRASVDGTLPHGAGVSALADLPFDWMAQNQSG